MMPRPLHTLSLLFGLGLSLAGTSVQANGRAVPAFQIIVHPSNRTASLDRKFVEDAFLKKVTRWPDNDSVIRPVDLGAGSPVRRAFSESVLNRSVEAVKGYWQQRIFSGRDVPPPELDTDDDVVRYVLKYDGAVGYVSGGANLEGARVVDVSR
jgi:ABC-type phosphate transport system substrate-binding protein